MNKNLLKTVVSLAITSTVFAGSLLSFSTTAVASSPKLEITNQVDKAQADRGEVLTYNVVVKNAGDTDLSKIVTWTNPLNLTTWVNGSGTYTRDGVTKALANDFVTAGGQFATGTALKPGETISFKFQTKVADNANMDNIIWLVFNAKSEQTPSTVTSSSWTRVTLKNPALCAEKTADKSTVSVGEVVTFTIKVCNKGNIVLHNVVVGDVIQTPFRYVSGSAEFKLGNQVTKIEDHWLQDSFRIDYLNPGQEGVLTFKTTVTNEMKDGQTLQNVAQVKSDETPNWIKCPVYLKGKVLGVSTPPTELPNTGPGEVMLLISGLVPAGYVLKRFKSRI